MRDIEPEDVRVPAQCLLKSPEVFLPLLHDFVPESNLGVPYKSLDFSRADIIAKVVERIFREEFFYVVKRSPLGLCLSREVAVPSVRANHHQHVVEILIVGTDHAALDGGDMMPDVKREG